MEQETGETTATARKRGGRAPANRRHGARPEIANRRRHQSEAGAGRRDNVAEAFRVEGGRSFDEKALNLKSPKIKAALSDLLATSKASKLRRFITAANSP